jgi:hypothetical protein
MAWVDFRRLRELLRQLTGGASVSLSKSSSVFRLRALFAIAQRQGRQPLISWLGYAIRAFLTAAARHRVFFGSAFQPH